MKKFFAVLLAVFILAASSVPAFAAGLNSAEQSVLGNMRTPANMKGNSVYVPSSYINQAEAYFNTIDMTQTQANQINGIINQGRSFLESTGKASMGQLTSAEKNKIINYASAAAGVLRLSAAAGSDETGVKVITKSGETVIDDSGKVIKATGEETNFLPYIVIYALNILLVTGVVGVLVRKKALSYEDIKK